MFLVIYYIMTIDICITYVFFHFLLVQFSSLETFSFVQKFVNSILSLFYLFVSYIQLNFGLRSPLYYGHLTITVTLFQSQTIFNSKKEYDVIPGNTVTSILGSPLGSRNNVVPLLPFFQATVVIVSA